MRISAQECLTALQRGLPLAPRPFEVLADELGCLEDDLFSVLARAREEGHVRRFGAVFDTRRLGYTSVLCAAYVPRDCVDDVAARLTPLRGVTHCYLREVPATAAISLPVDTPNLWFTLSYPHDVFDTIAADVRARLAPYAVYLLPATRRYKVDVVFGAQSRVREEGVMDDAPPSASERAIIRALQGDTEIRSDYFTALAAKVGLPEWKLLATLEMWRRSGRLKRIGLLLAHRAAGWHANGMCCWSVGPDSTTAGRALAACGEVTHCYERVQTEAFPYNLFAMVHAHTLDDAQAQFRHLTEVAHLPPGVMLVSTKEYKKTSMTFFADGV